MDINKSAKVTPDDPRFADLQKYLDEVKDEEGPNLMILQQAQNIFGFLPLEVLKYISDHTGAPISELYGVATFYSQFTLTPKGKHTIQVCLGTACYVRGAKKIVDKLKEELNVTEGGTTADGLFTLETARCLGCCGLAPVMMIDGKVYANLVNVDKIPSIINEIRKGE